MSGHCKILAHLASGGMAEIFLGAMYNENGFSRLSAIKKIRPDFAKSPTYIKMFFDEAKVCQQLQHANIVQVLDFTKVDGQLAIIMEYVHGIDLKSLSEAFVSKGMLLPVPMITFVICEVAKGLQYVHSRMDPRSNKPLNIIHRDVSPNNILISSEGEVKITDFGIAKGTIRSEVTEIGVIKGKVSYMSPEQISGCELDFKTDIYSLGIVLWECLTGNSLFDKGSDQLTIQAVKAGVNLDTLRSFDFEIDEQLIEIVAKCVNPSRRARYENAGALAQDLNNYLMRVWDGFTSINLAAFVKQIAGESIKTADAMLKRALDDLQTEISSQNVAKSSEVIPVEPQRAINLMSQVMPTSPAQSRAQLQVVNAGNDQRVLSSQMVQLVNPAQPGNLPAIAISVNLSDKNPGENLTPIYHGNTLKLDHANTALRQDLKPAFNIRKMNEAQRLQGNSKPVRPHHYRGSQNSSRSSSLSGPLIFIAILVIILIFFVGSKFGSHLAAMLP